MDGHSYAVLIVSVAVAAAAFDVIRVYRRLPKRLADGEAAAVDSVPAETVPPNTQAATAERNFGLVLASRAVFVALAVIAAGLLWSAEDDQHWTQDKVLHEAEKIAADMQAGGRTPGDGATPGAGSFKTLVDTEVQAVVKGNGLGLTDDFATPPRAPWTATSSPAPRPTTAQGRPSPPSTGPVSSSPRRTPSPTACRQPPVSARTFTTTPSGPKSPRAIAEAFGTKQTNKTDERKIGARSWPYPRKTAWTTCAART